MTGSAVAGRVETALRDWAGDHFGSSARVQAVRGPERRAWSYQFHFTVEEGGRRRELIAKIPRWEEAPTLEQALLAGPQSATREEHRLLGEVEEMVTASGDAGLSAIPVLAYLPGLNAIVTGKIEAVPLRARLVVRSAESSLAAAGRWLHRFHTEVGGAHSGSLDARDLATRLVEAAGALPNASGVTAAAATIAARAESLQGAEVTLAALHGDFNLSNVLVDAEGRVAVLDPNLEEGPVFEDAAKLLTDLRARRTRALTRGVVGSRHLAVRERAFLAGYRMDDGPLLRFFRAAATVRRWIEAEERIVAAPRLSPVRTAGVLVRRHLEAETAALLQD